MVRKLRLFFVVAALALIAGCRTAPVHDVTGAPIATSKPATIPQIQNAIVQAGNGLGWRMTPKGPGVIEGAISLRGHDAVVTITYDSKTYDIRYKSSENLNYDGTKIHSNYNGWVGSPGTELEFAL